VSNSPRLPEFDPRAATIREVGPASPYKWILQGPLSYGEYTVPTRFETDLASVPQPFTWLFPRYGLYTKAAIVHDRLCQTTTDRFRADQVLLDAMKQSGVGRVRRNIIWAAVNWFAVGLHLVRSFWFTLLVATFVLIGVTLEWLSAIDQPWRSTVWIAFGLLAVAWICRRTTTTNTLLAILKGGAISIPLIFFLIASIPPAVFLIIFLLLEDPVGLISGFLARVWALVTVIIRVAVVQLEPLFRLVKSIFRVDSRRYQSAPQTEPRPGPKPAPEVADSPAHKRLEMLLVPDR